MTGREQIRGLMDERIKAIRTKDIDAAVRNVAPDIRVFDVVNPLQYSGSDAVRKRAEEWFASFSGDIGYEIRDLSLEAGDNVAFCHCLTRVSGLLKDGMKVDMWFRTTLCYSKRGHEWKITHEHNSVPFDGMSGTASLDLKP